MRALFFSFVVFALLAASVAHADPSGRYSVSGTNPDNGRKYTGTVKVTRSGETYRVVWKIGKDVFNGVAIPGRVEDGRYVAGAATVDDTVLSVGYGSGNSFGLAVYVLKEDGAWEGVWTYAGSGKVATEIWLPM